MLPPQNSLDKSNELDSVILLRLPYPIAQSIHEIISSNFDILPEIKIVGLNDEFLRHYV